MKCSRMKRRGADPLPTLDCEACYGMRLLVWDYMNPRGNKRSKERAYESLYRIANTTGRTLPELITAISQTTIH